MNEQLALILGIILLNGIAGLAGALIPSKLIRRHHGIFLAFSIGTLLGVSLFDLLPEAFESGLPWGPLAALTLGGFVIFHLIEKLFGAHAVGHHGHRHQKVGASLLVGDALHNVTDGMAIAAAFLVDPKLGITTGIVVLLHEIPQEIGDYVILIEHGYKKWKALTLLALVQLTSAVGALAVYFANNALEGLAHYIAAFAAGGFLYIAGVNLLPELKSRLTLRSQIVTYSLSLAFGAALIKSLHLFHHH